MSASAFVCVCIYVCACVCAGAEVVIEERLVGEEASVLALTDGTTVVTLPPSQDHKRIFDGDLVQ